MICKECLYYEPDYGTWGVFGMKKRLKTVLVTLIFIWLTMGLLALARYIT